MDFIYSLLIIIGVCIVIGGIGMIAVRIRNQKSYYKSVEENMKKNFFDMNLR